jgi:hypothetical protein
MTPEWDRPTARRPLIVELGQPSARLFVEATTLAAAGIPATVILTCSQADGVTCAAEPPARQ